MTGDEWTPERPADPFAAISRVISSETMPEALSQQLSCYVALGDSFTAGTGCPEGLGWADRLAAGLRLRHFGLSYRNLAVDGATSTEVLEQLPEAVELEPDLVTVVCGANDVLRTTRPDPLAYAANMSRILRRVRDAVPGVMVITATSPEGWDFVPLGPRSRERIEAGMRRFNAVTREFADLHDIPCLDVTGHPGLSERENFAEDGLHPSPRGHARAAMAFARIVREHYRIPIGHLEGGLT
jgi:phosphatidylinositol alpha 1,6-mannosyltransferase